MRQLLKKWLFKDEHHTIEELYEYRMAYNALAANELCNTLETYKSIRHADGELCFGGGWFIVVIELPGGQISNHYRLEYWDCFNVEIKSKAVRYDGHTPEIALSRIIDYVTSN